MSETNVQDWKSKKELKFYRPNKNGNGAASQWEVSKNKDGEYLMFLTLAKQKIVTEEPDKKAFDWDNKIVVKLDNPDLGEMLAVISGRKDGAGGDKGLFHKPASGGSKVIQFFRGETGYSLSVSFKADGADLIKIYHGISDGEVETLRVFITEALKYLNNW